MIRQADAGPGGRTSQLSIEAQRANAEIVLQLACWTAATGQGARADTAGAQPLLVVSRGTEANGRDSALSAGYSTW